MLTNANTSHLTNTDCDSNGYCNCDVNRNGYSNGNGDSHSYGYSYRYCNVYTRSELNPAAYSYPKVQPGTKNSANSAATPVAGNYGLVERVVP